MKTWEPGLVNTNWEPGPVNTNWGPGPGAGAGAEGRGTEKYKDPALLLFVTPS